VELMDAHQFLAHLEEGRMILTYDPTFTITVFAPSMVVPTNRVEDECCPMSLTKVSPTLETLTTTTKIRTITSSINPISTRWSRATLGALVIITPAFILSLFCGLFLPPSTTNISVRTRSILTFYSFCPTLSHGTSSFLP
jgi:hypothetical protein